MGSNNSKKSTSTPTLSDEYIKYIDNYSDEITHIEGTINQMRARVGMYLGAKGKTGLLTMYREIFQNSIDQFLDVHSPCDTVIVVYDERKYKFTISDNGAGIPFEKAVQIYTEGHTGKNLTKKKKGDYSAGLNGVGAKVTNAVSEHFDVHSYKYDGTCLHLRFHKGQIETKEFVPNKECWQGTTIEFDPDHSILGDTPLPPNEVYSLTKDIVSLLPIGSKVNYTSINKQGKVFTEDIINEKGITTSLYERSASMLINPVIISFDNGDMKLDCAFVFDQQDLGGEDVVAYANMCPTSASILNTHVTGTLEGISTWFCNYMNKTFLTDREKGKFKITAADVKAGLKLMISAWHLEPEFTGQAKEVFSNLDFKPFAKDVISEGLTEWAKAKPQDLLKVCKFLKDIATARIKAETEKVKVTAKYTTSATSGLPAKYNPPSGKKNLELFIVEGDSALGSAKSARDPSFQGVFPIRGKILNVNQAPMSKILANAEVMGIMAIIGAGYGKNFDINKVKFDKIILMTDADSDGAHIKCLLLIMFLKMCPGLVESGRVYAAVPPLYGIPNGKGKFKYFADRISFTKYMQKKYYEKHTVLNKYKKAITGTEFAALLESAYDNDFMYNAGAIISRYKISPRLLEIVLSSYVLGDKFEILRKKITSEWRFMTNDNVTKVNKETWYVNGLINGRIEKLFINARFYEECESIMKMIHSATLNNQLEFIVDGKPMCLYELIDDTTSSMSISRYKGLGEMNAANLEESTMCPATRNLVQYTVDDINETMNIIRRYDSDKSKILTYIKQDREIHMEDLIGL